MGLNPSCRTRADEGNVVEDDEPAGLILLVQNRQLEAQERLIPPVPPENSNFSLEEEAGKIIHRVDADVSPGLDPKGVPDRCCRGCDQ